MVILSNKLKTLGIRNAKDIVVAGLQRKIDDMGELRVPFDISTDYPSRETYQQETDLWVNRRRVVVQQLANEVARYGIGHEVSRQISGRDMELPRTQGWVDNYVVEVSIWSTSSSDRDDIVELMKLWMLELEQDVRSGNMELELPYFFDRDIFAVRFVRAYEGVNHSLVSNGAVYIGTLVYHVLAPFFHDVTPEEFMRYRLLLTQRVVERLDSSE